MSTLVTRAGKGSPLTHNEVDANFNNLNSDKSEKANNLSDLTSAPTARTNLGLVIGTDVLSPSGSGASLTSLNATNISSGTIAAARLPTGTAFAAGTALLFQQTAAPTGWTKVTSNDDAALRVVSGSVTTGGSVGFTTAFASKSVTGTVGATTLTTSQIPAHGHTFSGQTGGISANHTHQTYDWGNNAGGLFIVPGGGYYYNSASNFTSGTVSSDHSHGYSGTTANAGSGGSHDHTFTGTAINLAVKYVDIIIATKN